MASTGHAERIHFKGGSSLDATVIETTDDSVTIEFNGIQQTISRDQIESIGEIPPRQPVKQTAEDPKGAISKAIAATKKGMAQLGQDMAETYEQVTQKLGKGSDRESGNNYHSEDDDYKDANNTKKLLHYMGGGAQKEFDSVNRKIITKKSGQSRKKKYRKKHGYKKRIKRPDPSSFQRSPFS